MDNAIFKNSDIKPANIINLTVNLFDVAFRIFVRDINACTHIKSKKRLRWILLDIVVRWSDEN